MLNSINTLFVNNKRVLINQPCLSLKIDLKHCFYPKGDLVRETYRLSTFHQYPRDTPVDPRQLAAHGFYFTGYRDRVKCLS